MSTYSIGASILAAGLGTRMNLGLPKPMAPICGLTLVDFSIITLKDFIKKNNLNGHLTCVVGHQKELLQDYVSKRNPEMNYAWQKEQKGTADALKAYFDERPENKNHEFTIVICGDTPLIQEHELSLMFNELKSKNLDGVAATFEAPKPTGYGRIIRGKNGFSIVEEKDATADQKLVTEVNAGLYIVRTKFALEHLYNIKSNNKAGEFYLTDLFKDEYKVSAVKFDNQDSFLGVNTLEQLEYVTKIQNRRIIAGHRLNGVRFIDSETVYIDAEVSIGKQTVIYPNVHLYGKTQIGEQCIIEPSCIVKNSVLENKAELYANSYLEKAMIRSEAQIGPFARIRPDADIGPKSKIGNFVEIKKAKLAKGVKVSHLSYVGDAEIGENSNIGCGFITCNYDGKNKHKTIIGSNTFIGSDSQMVAPVNIGSDAFVAAGSCVTHDVPDGGFAIARSKQTTKEDMAKRFLKK